MRLLEINFHSSEMFADFTSFSTDKNLKHFKCHKKHLSEHNNEINHLFIDCGHL